MRETKRPLKVFLCHASADKSKVRELYRYLRRRGIKPWFDEMDLVGGQDWQVEIPKALSTSDAIIICLSKNSVDKEGYIQKEIKFALDRALEMPEGRIFLIPVKFEECEVPFTISRYQWVDLFDEAGYARMMRSLKFRAAQLERATVEVSKKDVEAEKRALEKAAREKVVREADEKGEREKAEREKQEQAAREQLESEAAESARREKAEREASIKAMRDQANREAAEEARRERAKRLATQIAMLKENFSILYSRLQSAFINAKPVLSIAGIIASILILVWTATVILPTLFSPVPGWFPPASAASITPTNTLQGLLGILATTQPVSKTNTPSPVVTETEAPASTPLPPAVTDAQGVPMVLVPAGEFAMGATFEEADRAPAHIVFLDAFYIDKYEVTNRNYRSCDEAGECDPPKYTYADSTYDDSRHDYYGNPEYDDFPVVFVDWDMARVYCEWRGATLPTEAQWEKAARGTDERTYPWGNTGDCTRANYSGGGSCSGEEGTTAVGSYERGVSPYGAYDMAGNVWEWVNSLYRPYPYNVSDGREGLAGNGKRVMRGGSWNDGDAVSILFGTRTRVSVQTTQRLRSDQNSISSTVGFRCAKDADP